MKDEKEKLPITGYFPGLIDLGTKEEEVVFIAAGDKGINIIETANVNGVTYCPPERADILFSVPRTEEVIQAFHGDTDRQLFIDILAHLKRFFYLDGKHMVMVVCYVMLTYLQDHPGVQYMPIILLYAVPERGKSRTGKSIVHIAFRGMHLLDVREANILRFSQDYRATLFFDCLDLWTKVERKGTEDILLCRFEKGARATRVIHPNKGAFKDMKHFHVYGPTIIATNEPVHEILDTRCLFISMPSRPGTYEDSSVHKCQEIRARLTAFRARHLFSDLPVIEGIREVSGRLFDIAKPLLQVCELVCPEQREGIEGLIREMSIQRQERKRSSIEGQIVAAIKQVSGQFTEEEFSIESSSVLRIMNEERPDKRKYTAQWLGLKIKSLGIKAGRRNGRSILFIRRNELNDLAAQYGLQ